MAYRYYDFKYRKQTKSESLMYNNNNHDIPIRNKLPDVEINTNNNSNMVKHLRNNKNGKKFAHNPSLLSNGDQELNDKIRYNGNKTPVYVHDFKINYNVKNDNYNNNNNMKTYSNVYTHGFQDYLNGKSKYLKSKFDSLTLINNKNQLANYNIYNQYNSQQLQENNNYQSNNLNVRNIKQRHQQQQQQQEPTAKRSKLKNTNEFDETVINQIEESYWANWRPNKKGAVKSHIKKSLDKVYSERIQNNKEASSNKNQTNTKKNSNAMTNVKKNTSKKLSPPSPPPPPVSRKQSNLSDLIQEEPIADVTVKETEKVINITKKISEEIEILQNPSENLNEKSVKVIHEPTVNSYNIDVNYSEEFNLIMDGDNVKKHSIESISSRLKLIDISKDIATVSTTTSLDVVTNKRDVATGSSHSSLLTLKKDLHNIDEQLSNKVQPHLVNSGTCTSDQDIRMIKHTDSFIITTRKQNVEKQHYPQPKCIKLQKNSNVINRSHNYIKGGSYPLKSCLKKEKLSSQSSILGKPGSPMLLQPNRNKKTKKFK